MISPNRETFYNILSSLASMGVSSIVMFLIYRIGNRVLGVELIGLWSVVATITSLGSIGTFGLSSSLVIFSADAQARNEMHLLPGLINGVLWRMGGLLIIFLLFLYAVTYWGLQFFVDELYLGVAFSLLPLSFFIFWVNSIAQLCLSAIEGLNKIWQKNLVLIAGQIVFVVLAIHFIDDHGILGILYAQLVQMVLLLICALVLLKSNISGYTLWTREMGTAGVKRAMSYGAKFQAQSLLQILGEPVTKMFLSRYGGLSFVGYYEMASRFVLQLRQIMLTIMNSLLPRLVQVHAKGTAIKLEETYRRIFAINLDLSTIAFGALFLFCPILIQAWLGESVPEMIMLTRILALAWFVNACAIVPYLFNISSDNLGANILSHTTVSGLNIIFSLLLIFLDIDAIWFVYVSVSSLAIGSIYLIVEYGRRRHIATRSLLSLPDLKMVGVTLTSALLLFLCLQSGLFPYQLCYILVGLVFLLLSAIFYRQSPSCGYIRFYLSTMTKMSDR